ASGAPAGPSPPPRPRVHAPAGPGRRAPPGTDGEGPVLEEGALVRRQEEERRRAGPRDLERDAGTPVAARACRRAPAGSGRRAAPGTGGEGSVLEEGALVRQRRER